MKHDPTTMFVLSAIAAAGIVASGRAATWTGDTDADFQNGANWSTDPVFPTLTETLQFNTAGISGTAIGNVTYTAGSTLGKIAFGGVAPAYTLQGGAITLFNATGDAIRNDSSVTQTIASNLVLGDGAASTISLTNTNIAGGLLKITGSITGGSGAVTPGALVISLGSTSSNNGNHEITGNITKGGAASIGVTKRGSGTVTLSGTNNVLSLASNEANSTILINGGTTTIANAAGGGWGGNTLQSAKYQISTGGTLDSFDSRNVRNSILVDGGTLNLGQGNTSGGARFSFNNPGNATPHTFGITGGNVRFLPGYATNNFGVRLGNDSGTGNASAGASVTATQSGGTFIVNGAGGQDSTFSLGTAEANKTNSYTLGGGTLDIRGTDSTNGHLTIGADTAGTGTTSFNLSGGKLLVRSGSAGLGINGRNANGVQIFNVTGGTLVAGEITTANLRAQGDSSNGVFTNKGGNLAPGDIGTTGKTTITGDYAVTSGTLTIDLAGLAASTAFQDASLTGRFDQLAVTGNLSLGGTLGLNLVDSYIPAFGDTFKIIDLTGAATTLSNFFLNVGNGATLATLGGEGTFKVYSSGNDVYLSNFTAVPETGPAALLGGFGLLALIRRRR